MSSEKVTSLYLDGLGGCALDASATHQIAWHHLRYTDQKAKSWIKKQVNLSEQARMMLLNSETRPRTYIDNEDVLVCLRGINFNTSAQPEDMISIRMWLGPDVVITSSNQGSQSISNIKKALEQSIGPKTAEGLLLTLIDQLAHLTDEFVDQMDAKLDQLEDGIDGTSLLEFNPQMNQLRRQIANIRRYLMPQKEAIDKLYRFKSPRFGEAFYDQMFIHMDKFIQLIENLDLMRERALMLQEHFMANISHQQNSRLYLLAIVSVIFLPLTFVSGLFGMNVGGLPGTEDPVAFTYVVVFSVLVTVGLLIWFKKSRWF